ncbi:MAG: PBECR4 domain-containing protein [Clostridiaceae bacterium]|nr:PBECR4 domain-containing protein [Clostridiaceae bacterium]
MDLLLKCAVTFKQLMNFQYCFILGRKGQLKEIVLSFSETDFHHLVGLHKLKDIDIARANRSFVFRDILAGRITYDTLMKSVFIDEILSRLQTFPKLEILLDNDQLVFRYNKKYYPHSAIESEFLLKMGDGSILDISFLFLDKSDQGVYFCRSFFPMERTDYTKEQMQYTLLKKEKRNLVTGQIELQYDRLSPK